jgi:hypothetical protein
MLKVTPFAELLAAMASSHVPPAAPTTFVSANAPRPFRLGTADGIILGLAAAKLLLHLLTANRYGIFRDELYGLACAEHLDWGYPEHPPGGILIAWLARHLFGDSLPGLRFLPASAGAALVWLTGIVTREMGGRTFAQALAALAVCVAPIYLIFDHWLTMNAFEPLIWLGCVYCALRMINTGDGRYWLGFGVLAGLGLETKYSILFLIIGVLIGLLLTPQRQRLADGRLWIGLLAGGAIALPNFLWQLRQGFPFLEHMHHVAANHRDVIRGPIAFLADQTMIMEPMTAPLWIGGMVWLLIGRQRSQYGAFGWTFVFVVGAFVALKGKNYYVTPIYPIVFAAGAVAFEQVTERCSQKWTRAIYVTLVAVSGVVLMPMSVPILSPETLVRYEKRFGLEPPVVFERHNNGPLPQYFADEFGWEEMVREVARVYRTLSPADQKRTAIFSNNWGDAAAVDFFGSKYGLPRAISNNLSYWEWGPRDYTGEIVIVLHSDGIGDRQHFATIEKAGHVEHPYSRRDEWFDIYLCRGLKYDLRETWPKMKLFD